MNRIYEFVEQIAGDSITDSRNPRLIGFTHNRFFRRRDFHNGTLIFGSPNAGKTVLLRTLARALLRDRQGGLALSVKRGQVQEFLDLCALEGRSDDCVVISPDHSNRFNPLLGEKSIHEAAAFICELIEVMQSGSQSASNEDPFWQTQLQIIAKNLFKLCLVHHGRIDIVLAAELFDARPISLAHVTDPGWRRNSVMAAALEKARRLKDDIEAQLAVEYFEQSFPSHGDRLQGSLAATVNGVFDSLRRPPLRELFAGESTFSMHDLLNCGRICIVAMPVLDGIEGRLANAILQFSFCKAATRIARTHDAFLISDECQETVTRELMRKLAVIRESRVASILLTQNLAVLDEKLGESSREAMLGLLGTKIFGMQSHAGTRQWASEQIGKEQKRVDTHSSGTSGGQSNSSQSYHFVWDYRVPPIEFSKLRQGQTIILRGADSWRASWHKDRPGVGGTARIVDKD